MILWKSNSLALSIYRNGPAYIPELHPYVHSISKTDELAEITEQCQELMGEASELEEFFGFVEAAKAPTRSMPRRRS